MNIEQLKLILETLQTIGLEGKSAFIWWLLVHDVLPLLAWFVFGSVFTTLAYKLILAQTSEGKLREIRDTLGVGSHGFYTSAEHSAVLVQIKKLKQK